MTDKLDCIRDLKAYRRERSHYLLDLGLTQTRAVQLQNRQARNPLEQLRQCLGLSRLQGAILNPHLNGLVMQLPLLFRASPLAPPRHERRSANALKLGKDFAVPIHLVQYNVQAKRTAKPSAAEKCYVTQSLLHLISCCERWAALKNGKRRTTVFAKGLFARPPFDESRSTSS